MPEIFAWPIAVVVLVSFALILFRKAIERLLDRTTRLGKEGLIASNKSQDVSKESKPSTVEDFLKKTFDNALLVEVEEKLKQQLDAIDAKNPTEKEKLLLRLLASLVIIQSFDRTYFLIYGSQLVTLQHLNDLRGQKVLVSDLITFYDIAKKSESQFYAQYPFDRWFEFLISSFLVRKDGDFASITLRGKEFLKYLIEQGYTTLKSH
jgi:hypothetical protein